MRLRQENGPVVVLWVWIAFFAVLIDGEARAAKGLSRATLLGYAQWLQALDAEPKARLYPTGRTEAEIGAGGPERRLTAARALLDYDESVGRAWDDREFGDAVRGINHARSSAEILDYQSALDWYGMAVSDMGGATAVDDDLSREIFATAIQSGDSLLIIEQLLNTVGAPRLERRAGAVVLAYRHYLGRHDRNNLNLLIEKVGAQIDRLPAEVRFWHAFALVRRDRPSEAAPLLLSLASDARLSERLEPAHVAWFVRTLPDLLLVTDRRRDAYRLYTLLAARDDVEAGRWARYVIAYDLMLAGRYEEAAPLLEESCNATDPASWQLRACALAEAAVTLADIRKEGAPYGIDSLHAR